MSAIPQSGFVSERILEPLRQVAKRQWAVLAIKGVVQTLLFSLSVLLLAVLFLGVVLSGLGDPIWVRVPAALIVWGLIVAAAVRFLRPALRQRSLVQTAREVEEQLLGTRNVQERISSSIELGSESDERFTGSPVLVAHLVKQAEADAAVVDPTAVVPVDKIKRLAMLLIPLVVLWMVLAFLLPREKMLRPMWDLFVPWKSAPAVLSHVMVEPGDVSIAQGDSLEIRVSVNADSAAERDRRIERSVVNTTDAGGHPVDLEMNRVRSQDAAGKAVEAPRAFHLVQENVQKGFQYRVSTDEGKSPWYTVTVNPRPSVEQLDLRYEYPAYTGLQPKLDTNSESGSIEALQNTRVTIIVHCSDALAAASKVAVTDRMTSRKAEAVDYPLTKAADGTWQARIPLINSADYAIKLTNNNGLTNKDDQPHLITVRFDEKPAITILSPPTGMTVRPDDVVPVRYAATDDFGVARVDAFVQVDGASQPKQVSVTLPGGDHHTINSTYKLDLGAILSDAKLPDSIGLTYWLAATDNRDPDPQSTESARQTLHLDRTAKGVNEQLDAKRGADLLEAIKKAIAEIDLERPPVEVLSRIDANRPLSNDEKQKAEAEKDRIEKTSGDLVAATDQHKEDSYADLALKARSISEKYILGASDNVARVTLHADSGSGRNADVKEALDSLAEGRRLLAELVKEIEKRQRLLQAGDQFADLAKDQEKLADKQAQGQPPDQTDQQKQADINQKTQQAIAEAQFSDPNAKTNAERQAQLLNKIAEIQKGQEAQEQQVQKQAAVAEIQQHASAIAQRQDELNQKIQDFKKKDDEAISKGKVGLPLAQLQESISKDLKDNIPKAAEEQKSSAAQLEAAANQLQQQNQPEAASEAQELAHQQQALADMTQPDSQALQQQGPQTPQQSAAEQNKLAQQTQEAQNAADQLQKQSENEGDKELSQRAEEAQQDLNEAKEAQQEAAKAEEASEPREAAADQEKAENSLAKAEQALRGESQKQASAQQKSQGPKGEKGQGKKGSGKGSKGQGQGKPGQSPSQAQAQASEPHPGEPGQGQTPGEPSSSSPQQSEAQAAERAQEAAQAEGQASSSPAASQEAAQSLAEAAQALGEATSPSNQPGQGQEPGEDGPPSDQPGKPGKPGKPSKKPSRFPGGRALESLAGLQPGDIGGGDTRPEAVQQLGITTSDWAHLGPLQQQELLNAAQQSGPPAYQEMIRNYYVRLAHVQAQSVRP